MWNVEEVEGGRLDGWLDRVFRRERAVGEGYAVRTNLTLDTHPHQPTTVHGAKPLQIPTAISLTSLTHNLAYCIDWALYL